MRVYLITSPPDLPIFRECPTETTTAQIALQFPSSLLRGERLIDLETVVQPQGVPLQSVPVCCAYDLRDTP